MHAKFPGLVAVPLSANLAILPMFHPGGPSKWASVEASQMRYSEATAIKARIPVCGRCGRLTQPRRRINVRPGYQAG